MIDRTQPLIPAYHPDSYQFIRISSKGDNDKVIKLFAVWNGSYLDSDSWKMNSGCTKITQDAIFDNLYIVEGYSGSRYVINKASTTLSSYGMGVLTDIIKRAEKADIVVEMISLDEAKDYVHP